MRFTAMNTPTDKQQFLLLSEEERKEILQTLGTKRGQSPAVLEKDVWVCWALKTLFEIPQPHSMAFKGGTSLSKVFNVIERFSEDIDITLDYKSLLPTAEPFHPEISKTQIKKLAEQLRALVCTHTNEVILPAFKTALKEQFGADTYGIRLSEDGEILSVQYRPLFQANYIREQVLIEFGGRNAITPSSAIVVAPYIAKDIPELVFPEAAVMVLAAERTFWEKVTLMHAECNTRHLDKLERKCRHWYDIYKLSKTTIGQAALADRELLNDVLRHKQVFYSSKNAKYELCSTEMKLVPDEEMLRALEQDYKKMIDDGMFYAEPPTFDNLITELRELEEQINLAPATELQAQGEATLPEQADPAQ